MAATAVSRLPNAVITTTGTSGPVGDDALAQLEAVHAAHVEVGDDDVEVARAQAARAPRPPTLRRSRPSKPRLPRPARSMRRTWPRRRRRRGRAPLMTRSRSDAAGRSRSGCRAPGCALHVDPAAVLARRCRRRPRGPRPVPSPTSLVVKNGSKTCGRCSAAMPSPSSTHRRGSGTRPRSPPWSGGGSAARRADHDASRAAARHRLDAVDHQVGQRLLHLRRSTRAQTGAARRLDARSVTPRFSASGASSVARSRATSATRS